MNFSLPGCHRYFSVEYTPECKVLTDGTYAGWAGLMDTGYPGRFSNVDGVLEECRQYVTNVQVFLWGQPASEPVSCTL